MADDFDLTVDHKGIGELFNSAQWGRALDKVGFAIDAAAIPHSGVDTGRLIGSMGHAVVKGDEALELELGSGVGDAVESVEYAFRNWADAKPGTTGRAGYPGDTWVGTKPYSKAFDELGIEWEIEPGGFEI